MRLYSKSEIAVEIQRLSSDFYCQEPTDTIRPILENLRPPIVIPTVQWAEENRKFRSIQGNALIPYDRWRTPYNIAKMDALDHPSVELVVIVKPSRSGGTTVAENYLGKMIDVGPMGRVGWYLGSDIAAKNYCSSVINPMFEDNRRLSSRIGTGRSDNNDTKKLVAGQIVEFLSASDSNMRNREFVYGVMDESDGWVKFSENPEVQLDARQKQIGNRRKGIILSHPDKGWSAGVASIWESSSRGIYIMRCVSCKDFAAAHATKYWPGVPEFKLHYAQGNDWDFDQRIDAAERTAGMLCPHCGTIIADEERFAMVDEAGAEGWWMHRGQELKRSGGVVGDFSPHKKRGFYDHGLMLKVSTASQLARGLEECIIKHERTRGGKIATRALRQYMSKQLGEIFEGKAALLGLNADTLRNRTYNLQGIEDNPLSYKMGQVPEKVRFATCYIDVGHHKFDVMIRGWDLERRSWVIDRYTIRQRLHDDGVSRDLNLLNVQADWLVLDSVINRLLPIQGNKNYVLPVACMMIDSGDGNVIYQAAEYVRSRINISWKDPNNPAIAFPKIWCAKGIGGNQPPLSLSAKELNTDSNGKAALPAVKLQLMGVDGIKDDLLGNDDGFGYLSIDDGSPGQIYYPSDFPQRAYQEIFAEPKIDGKYERSGPNETLDLLVGTEAGRLLMQPDRRGRDWTPGKESSVWARRVYIGTESKDAASQPQEPVRQATIFEQFAAINDDS